MSIGLAVDALVVDDSADDRRLASSLLEEHGCLTVGAVSHGVEALAHIEQNMPDVVVTDLRMPEMDGLELVQVLRQRFPQLPVILMTANGSEEIALKALRFGAASYVPKRNLSEDLVPTVDNVLARTRVGRRHEQLLDCLTQSDHHFTIKNNDNMTSLIVEHIQDGLQRMQLCEPADILGIGGAVEAALQNALYHGNLEIAGPLHADHDHKLADERRNEAPFCERKIYVRVKLAPDELRFVVRDEGPGFDQAHDAPASDVELIDHAGRGLVLMRTHMDRVEFNEMGNEVTLIKRCSPPSDSDSTASHPTH